MEPQHILLSATLKEHHLSSMEYIYTQQMQQKVEDEDGHKAMICSWIQLHVHVIHINIVIKQQSPVQDHLSFYHPGDPDEAF